MLEREVHGYLTATLNPELRWGLLPERLRSVVGTEAEWLKVLRAHSIGVQAPWTPSLGGDAAQYLAELITLSRERGLLFPYHLVGDLAANAQRMKDVQTCPFDYYVEMIVDRMRSERSYDTIPSFTAADCVRLVQCGRNEFIHALNQCRSKGWLWKRRRGMIARHLPAAPPTDLPVLHWWEVYPTRAAGAALAAYNGRTRAAGGASSRPAAMRRAGKMLSTLGGSSFTKDDSPREAAAAVAAGSPGSSSTSGGSGGGGGGGGGCCVAMAAVAVGLRALRSSKRSG